jgi:hypothetical protein
MRSLYTAILVGLWSLSVVGHTAEVANTGLHFAAKSTKAENTVKTSSKKKVVKEEIEEEEEPSESVMPQALVPGLVQFQRNEVGKGILLVRGVIFSLSMASQYSSAGDGNYALYQQSGSSTFRSYTEQADGLFSFFALSSLGFYVYNIWDATKGDSDPEEQSTASPYAPTLGFSVLPDQSMTLALEWRI